MDKRVIIDGLRDSFRSASHPEPQRGVNCLGPEALAAFLDGSSGQIEHIAHEAHLADCAFCLQQLSRISQSREDGAGVSVPHELLLQAEALGAGPRGAEQGETKPIRSSPWFGSIPAAVALAAVVVLAVGLFPLTDNTIAPPVAAPPVAPTTRYADTSAAMNPRVLAPVAGSLIVPAEQVFHWSEVPGSLFYDVSLVDAEGEVLLRDRVETTRWLIPDSLALHAGGEYYVRVDAYLDDERFLSSEHVMFSVRSDP